VKRSDANLAVGASILLAIFILIGGVLWLKEISITSRMSQYTVLFPRIGSLQVGDQVTINGVKKGSVKSMELVHDSVAVVINLDNEIVLTDSAHITVQNIGLLGERGVEILLSKAGTKISPEETDNPVVIRGHFDTGISEAMGMVGSVLKDVQRLVDNVDEIIGQTIGDTVFVDIFNQLVARIDTVSVLVEDIIVENKDNLDRTVTNLETVSRDIRRILDDNDEQVNAIMTNGAALTEEALTLVDDLNSISQSFKTIVQGIEQGEGSVGLLLNDEQFYYDLKATLANIDTLVDETQEEGLKLRVKLGFKKRRK